MKPKTKASKRRARLAQAIADICFDGNSVERVLIGGPYKRMVRDIEHLLEKWEV